MKHGRIGIIAQSYWKWGSTTEEQSGTFVPKGDQLISLRYL